MIQAFYNLMGSFSNTYFDLIVFAMVSIIVLYMVTCVLNIFLSFKKS